jgi:hypothetical protein
VPVSSIRKDYLLSEAVELIGRRIYGGEWSGSELYARPCPSPEELAEARKPFEGELAEADAALARIQQRIRSTLSEEETKRLLEQKEAAISRRVEVHHHLRVNPAPTDVHAQDHATFQRREKAVSTLLDGLALGRVKAHNGNGYPIDSWLWKGHQYFRYNICLSSVRLPSNVSDKRHQPARLEERAFDDWCSTLEVLTPAAEQGLSAKERCKIFLRTKLDPSAPQKPKADYLAEAQALIPDLSKRAFESVWAEQAPDELRKGGRRKR